MKITVKILAGLIALILAAAVILLVVVDPNQFKPRIEAMAKEQGIALQLQGDLGWTFWPSLGFSVAGIKVANPVAPQQPLAELARASLKLNIPALFSGNFQVNHIIVEGATINFALDKQGQSNWAFLTKKSAAATNTTNSAPAATTNSQPAATTSAAPDATSTSGLKLDVEQISLLNSALSYSDAQTGQTISLHDLNLNLTHVNLEQQPFMVDMSWVLELMQAGSAEKLRVEGKLHNSISLDKAFSKIAISEGKLQVTVTAKAPVEIAANYALALTDPTTNLSYSGQLELQSLNVRQLLAAFGTSLDTANAEALKSLTLSTTLSGDANQVSLSELNINLDKTQFNGLLSLVFATQALNAKLHGSSINVDDYLAPEKPEAAPVAAAPSEDTPLPMEILRQLNLDTAFMMDKVIVKKMTLESIDLQVKAKKGVIQQTLAAKAYDGAIQLKTKTDARSEKATITFDGGVQGFEIGALLRDMKLDEKMALSGAIQANAQGLTLGASVNQLIAGVDAVATFSGAKVRMMPLNVEEQFCKLVNLVGQFSAQESTATTESASGDLATSEQVSSAAAIAWDAFTEMRKLDGKVVWKDQVITLESFNAGVSQLLLNSTGKINLASDKYEFKMPLKLAQASDAAAVKGCNITISSYWADRSLSLLRCKGSFAGLNPLTDCGFDKTALRELTKDFAEYKLREKHGAKIDAAKQKLDDKKQALLEDASKKLGGDGSSIKPKDVLGNLLKKKLGGDKSASSSAASSAPSGAE